MEAGIKVWMLTGDKQETAIYIGLSTSIIRNDDIVINFNEFNLMVRI